MARSAKQLTSTNIHIKLCVLTISKQKIIQMLEGIDLLSLNVYYLSKE